MSYKPQIWTRQQLEQILFDITNGTTQNQIDTPTPYPVTRIETISDGVIDKARIKYLKEITDSDFEKYKLQKGDILFSHINSIGHIGKSAIYNNEPKTLIHGMNLLRLRPNQDKIIPEYLFNVINYQLFRNRVKSLAKKAINQASINQKEVGSILVPVPPLVEQRGIVEVLGTVDECIRLTDEVIGRAEELKRGLMQRLLTRGIGHTEYKQTPLGEIPKTWKIVKLNEISEIFGGSTPSTKNSEYWNGSIPFVTPTDITSVENGIYLENTEKSITDIGFKESSLRMIPKDSILLTSRATIGECLINKLDVTTNQGFANIIPNENINKIWLLYYMKSQKRELERLASGSTFREVSRRSIRNLKTMLPPLNEQHKISEILITSEDKISLEKEKRKYLYDLKQGLMQNLLSGKIRVELREDGLHRIRDS